MFMMFGEDFFKYVFVEKRTCHVHDDFKPQFVYNRHEWNCEYENMISNSLALRAKCKVSQTSFGRVGLLIEPIIPSSFLFLKTGSPQFSTL